MPAMTLLGFRMHGIGIMVCAIAAFVVILFTSFAGWDVGDARSGDVVRPESSFSPFERGCYAVSHAMTAPLRWTEFRDSGPAGFAAFGLLCLAWGTLGYLLIALLVRAARRSRSAHS